MSNKRQITKKDRRLIVVLGMHRSGTSAVARGLQAMGVDLGNNLMPPVPGNNEKGFWEDLDIYSLNIEMLNALNMDWHFLTPIQSSDVDALRRDGYLQRALDLLKGKTSGIQVFGFKDPRATKLLPLWKEVFIQNQLKVNYIITLRHPLSVCQSLAKRDGFDIEKGALLWLEHVIGSLVGTLDEKRLVVDYDRLMQSPDAELRRIAKKFQLQIIPSELIRYKTEFLDNELRHTVYQIDDLVNEEAIPPLAREIYTGVLKVAIDDEKLDTAFFKNKIAQWNNEFSRQKPALTLVDNLTKTLAKRDAQISDRDAQLAERNTQLAKRNTQLAERNAQLVERNAELDGIKSSRTWRMALILREIRVFLIPPNSLRAQIARKILTQFFFFKSFREQSKIDEQRLRNYTPKVSIIIPNYNHAKYLEKRIETILNQSYRNFEVLILDDCSEDKSREIIINYAEKHSDEIKYIFNDRNSGNVFRQWKKGIDNTTGDLIWICESDDFSETDFLEKIVMYFANTSVNIAFGKIQFVDDKGKSLKGLDSYREGAEKGVWNNELIRPAFKWFSNGFGVNNLIANVGGCVFRRQRIPDHVWEEAETYTVLGDWFLYCQIANGGMIAYNPDAIAYFRQHDGNTSVSSFRTPPYYLEHQKLMETLKTFWNIPDKTVERFIQKVEFQYDHFQLEKEFGSFTNYINREKLISTKKEKMHILIGILGFSSGGGELFPIHLANQLQESGCVVSLFVYDMSSINQDMYSALNKRIAVYPSALVQNMGVENFIKDAGISLIHSHMISVDAFFFNHNNVKLDIPYLVTLHGSYDFVTSPKQSLKNIVRGVDSWGYTTDKNLDILREFDISENAFKKFPNAMPIDNEPFPMSRKELGVEEDAVVFSFVARGIRSKGWEIAILAFIQLRNKNSNVSMHLLLCGDGEETARCKNLYGKDPDITFLGYQSRINGLYRISDCAIVPTRFKGESYPLILIQAMQEGLPVIATDIGEIRNMLIGFDEEAAGILVENTDDTPHFINGFEKAMHKMLSASTRNHYRKSALRLGELHDMQNVANQYIDHYKKMIGIVK